jgi:hypothetical protein
LIRHIVVDTGLRRVIAIAALRCCLCQLVLKLLVLALHASKSLLSGGQAILCRYQCFAQRLYLKLEILQVFLAGGRGTGGTEEYE